MRARRVVVASVVAMLAATGLAVASGASTTEVRTIQDRDGDNRLEPAPGDTYVVRSELGRPSPERERTRIPLLTFGQMTDFQLVDEESPARVEFLDKLGPPFTAAYRPQEGTGPHVIDAMVREMRNAVSPVTHRRIDLAMTTGDNTDNTQCNETRWMIDLLDGAANRDAQGPGGEKTCLPADLRPRTRQVDPNSGIEGTCEPPDGRLYDGVRGSDEYYEPDSSSPPSDDGTGYSPFPSENGRPSSVRDFPGLFERMNEPFLPTGFDDLPWYGIFGNHDGLVQGNKQRSAAIDAIATGCVKVTGLPPDAEAQVRGALADKNAALGLALEAMDGIAQGGVAVPGIADVVPSDPRRHLLFKDEYMAQHFVTSGVPVGHGFSVANLTSSQGNYAFTPRPGLRFVVLDTVADSGGDGGNLDDPQFQWLDGELARADGLGELSVVFAHHSIETMNEPPVSPFTGGDNPPVPDPVAHFGEASPAQPCPAPAGPLETVKCLFLRHRSVIAYVAGHEHRNRVRPFPRSGPAGGGFWQIVTAAHIDWPQQSRLIDLVDNADDTLSIFGTLLDHAGPPNPGGPPPSDGRGRATDSVQRLASISRELSFNDPDADNGEDGSGDARGGPGDRNVELLVDDPRH